jgi:hypothetical protein
MKITWPLLILRLKVKSQTGHENILATHYLEKPLLDKHQTLYTVYLKELMTIRGFEVNASKVEGSNWT